MAMCELKEGRGVGREREREREREKEGGGGRERRLQFQNSLGTSQSSACCSQIPNRANQFPRPLAKPVYLFDISFYGSCLDHCVFSACLADIIDGLLVK